MRHKAQEWRIIMKKKTLALTMAMALVLSLAACGNSNADVAAESTAAATTEAAAEATTEAATEASTEAAEAVADEKSEGVMTYEEYMAADLDSEVVIEAYVQAKQSWWEDKATLYTQDQDGAYFIYNAACSEEDYAKLVPGTKIKVTGYKTEWSGEVEIAEGATFEIEEGSYIAPVTDVTDLLGTDDLINYQNQFVAFKGMTVEASQDATGNDVAFLYNYDGSGEDGNDLYFNVSLNGQTYTFTVESYLCDNTTDVYKAVKELKIGDKILAIDGKDAKGFTTEQVSSRLKGDPGSKVRVTVEHLTGGTETVTLQRERIAIPGVPYAGWVDEGIGYIRHSDFTEGCYEDMRAAIERLRSEGELKGLILDYRSNGGGIMQEAVKILGMFVPKGTEVVSTKGRTEDSRRVYRTESEPILPDLPLAVLINGNSASASEIVTGALQDLDRAVIIGQRSYGKGLVQTPRPLGYNAMLKLTTAKYYIPSGRCIQAIDYSHSQEGTVRSVPDSLISEYTTRAGRKVYDGGGIMPDIRTEPEYISRFAMTLYALGFIEDFGDEYVRRHPGQQIDIRTFSITDGDYAEFAEFMKDKEVPYESDTRRALKKLREAAKTDRFEEVEQQIAAIDSTLRDDTATNLETYRKEIVESINNDIVLRHGYSEGVIEHSLPDDGDVLKAIEILGNRQEYARIVTEQDTPRK